VNESPFKAAWQELAYHGGNLSAARRLCPGAPEPWIDLSTGINPVAYPLPSLTPDLWMRLPEFDRLAALEAIAARRYGASAEKVVAASGSQAIIQLLARLRPKARVGILGFSYSGHAQAWRAAGASVETVDEIADLAAFDVAIIVNPNNPDGRQASRTVLVELHRKLAARSGMLVVDEAFMDLDRRGESLIPVLPASHAIVLRSFGKTYGLAGLRLGFAIASADLAAPLRAGLGPWAVSGPAIAIGSAALKDDPWLERSRLRLETDVARLDRLLAEGGLEGLGGASLFRLVRHRDARRIFDGLLHHGILVRPFAEWPDRLRFGIPGDPEAWRRLEAALNQSEGRQEAQAL
jgi:cobalamin biosynthetic protein CobC